MDIKERIKMIMDHEQMTAAAFANSIGVAQATMSHTLGPRNKQPSTEFLLRLHEKYSYINLNWLMTGEGSMFNKTPTDTDPTANEITDFSYPLFSSENQKNTDQYQECSENRKETALETPRNISQCIVKQDVIYKEKPSRKITEIRIFFDDNTYETFKPEK